jgi:hypothetical protein
LGAFRRHTVLEEDTLNDLSQVLEKGTLLIIETGCYSDFGYCDPVMLLGNYYKAQLAEEFVRDFKPRYTGDTPSPGDFVPWLVSSGKAEHVDNVTAWHVGEYGRFEP